MKAIVRVCRVMQATFYVLVALSFAVIGELSYLVVDLCDWVSNEADARAEACFPQEEPHA